MDERPLTAGEIELARSMFGAGLDYERIRVIRRKWWPLQPRNIVMAPTGNLHFHPASELWSDDFARETVWRQGLFIHELTHVWQSQVRGRYYLPLMRHPFCRYNYALKDGWPFDRYGLEQQAEIVRHAFLQRRGLRLTGAPPPARLEALLPFPRAA